jgi:hypothetical protein
MIGITGRSATGQLAECWRRAGVWWSVAHNSAAEKPDSEAGDVIVKWTARMSTRRRASRPARLAHRQVHPATVVRNKKDTVVDLTLVLALCDARDQLPPGQNFYFAKPMSSPSRVLKLRSNHGII